MSDVGGVGSADRADGPDAVGGEDKGVSEPEAATIADDAVAASDDDAAAVGETVAASADTFEAAMVEDEAVEHEAPVEEPGLVESVAAWAGETAKGYATGAANSVLDAANLVNTGVNGALDAVGIDYEFETDMHIDATSPAEQAAQDAVTVASVVAGGAGLVKSAPAIGRALATGIDDITAVARGGTGGTTATNRTLGANTAGQAAHLGDLRPSEVARIQAATDELGSDLYVIGSAAKGARRNVDTDLPLADFGASKAGTRSDIDYVVRNGLDDAATRLDLPDVDPSFGVRGVDYLNLDSSPAIRFSPGRPPEYLNGGGRIQLN